MPRPPYFWNEEKNFAEEGNYQIRRQSKAEDRLRKWNIQNECKCTWDPDTEANNC